MSKAAYTYLPGGRLKEIRDWTPQGERTRSFAYGLAGRLEKVNDSQLGEFSYRYDKLGNRLEEQVGVATRISTFDWAGRMTVHDGKEATHDSVGNLASYEAPDGPRCFEFTVQSWLRKAQVRGITVSYLYDGEGNLVSREAGNAKTTFVADPLSKHWRPLLATDAQGKKTLYVWDGSTPLAAISEGRAQFFLHDHQGTLTARLDTAGQPGMEFQFAPFGQPVQLGGDELQPGFKGLFFDPQTSLYVDAKRTYEPQLGRFLQRDPSRSLPLALPKTESPYTFAGADPANPDAADAPAQEVPGAQPIATPPVDGLSEVLRETDGSSSGQQIIINNSGAGNVIINNAGDGSIQNNGDGNNIGTNGNGAANGASPPLSERFFDVIDIGIAAVGAWNPWVGAGLAAVKAALREWNRRQAEAQGGGNAGDNPNSDTDSNTSPDDSNPDPDATIVYDDNPGPGPTQMGSPDIIDLSKLPPDILQSIPRLQVPSSGGGAPRPGYNGTSGSGAYNPPQLPGSSSNGGGSNTGGLFFDENATKNGGPLSNRPSSKFEYDNSPGGNKGGAKIGFDDNASKSNGSLNRTNNASTSPSGNRNTGTSPTNARNVGGGSNGTPGGQRTQVSPFRTPSFRPVGGVALHGAGKALANLGKLEGVAIDANGRLVLIGKGSTEIGLPPLRTDELVTIFRCVYLHGDSPSVSIDPIPGDPNGPLMKVVHGKGTAHTYVGWVLFEADRIMKTYGQGKDNVTHQAIHSRVPGFESLFDLRFGDDDSGGANMKWHRYWFVPAATTRLQAGDKQLTLFHVPLKVQTETSVQRDGKVVPAPEVEPSLYAKTFAQWFSSNYENLAREIYSTPPPESGIHGKVAVLKEMERMALIAAIAETLHDQGGPHARLDERVPGATVSGAGNDPHAYGDAHPDHRRRRKDCEDFRRRHPVAAPENHRDPRRDARAEGVVPVVRQAIAKAPFFTPVSFTSQGQHYQALALPGNDTKALGGLGLEELDLEVPVADGQTISVVRQFHSFYEPEDAFGRGWTLDLPELQKQRLVTERTEKKSLSRSVYQLVSPLGTWNEAFTEYKHIAEFNGKFLAPRVSSDVLALSQAPEGGVLVHFRDGRRWHFGDDGKLARIMKDRFTVHYRWENGRLTAIQGWLGKDKKAEIRLEYDAQGRVKAARGSNGADVRYGYDSASRLTKASAPHSTSDYQYINGLVTGILRDGRLVRELTYNSDAQLIREKDARGRVRSFSFGTDQVTVTTAGGRSDVTKYDASFRPVRRTLANGSKMTWQYGANGGEQLIIDRADGSKWEVTRAADGRKQIVGKLASGGNVRMEKDAADRITQIVRNSQPVLTRQYRADGKLQSSSTEEGDVLPEYAADGALKGLFIGGQKNGSAKYGTWMHVTCDTKGRPVEVTDQWGLKLKLEYDQDGEVRSVTSGTNRVAKQKERGQITTRTSWGLRQAVTLGKDGLPQRSEMEEEGQKSVFEYVNGLPSRIKQWGGGELRIDYFTEGPNQGRLSQVRTADDLVVDYDYNPSGRIAGLTCGDAVRRIYTYDARGRITGSTEVPVE